MKARPLELVGKAARARILLAMHFYRRQLHEGVAAYCRERRWILDSYDHSPDLNSSNQWDGIIVLHYKIPQFQRYLKTGAPVVTLAMDERGAFRAPCVFQDHEAIGAMGAGHLLERGFKRLFFCGYDDAVSHARFRGMAAEAERQGVTAREICLPHESSLNGRHHLVSEGLSHRLLRAKIPFGVLAAHDLLASQVLDACCAAGLEVPEQVAVLGVDNDEIICDCAAVPLSSVDNNLFRHGYEAAKLLGEVIEGKSDARRLLVPPSRVVVRASSDTIATENPALAQILQFIHAQFADPGLSVKDLCHRFGLSRSKLWEVCAEAGLPPPGKIIHDVRLRRACLALVDTGATIEAISRQAGFASARTFRRYFRKMKGSSPETWRSARRGREIAGV